MYRPRHGRTDDALVAPQSGEDGGGTRDRLRSFDSANGRFIASSARQATWWRVIVMARRMMCSSATRGSDDGARELNQMGRAAVNNLSKTPVISRQRAIRRLPQRGQRPRRE